MGTFFHGWRRKTGLVTLLLACLFMGGWMRSVIGNDAIVLGFHREFTDLMIISASGHLQFERFTFDFSKESESSFSFDTFPDLFEDFPETFHLGWQSGRSAMEDCWLDRFTVLYWFIVIPLTALSAFLLLSSPRKTTQKKITEPMAQNLD